MDKTTNGIRFTTLELHKMGVLEKVLKELHYPYPTIALDNDTTIFLSNKQIEDFRIEVKPWHTLSN